MQNFFPIGHVDADVYIGTGAGKRILDEIKKAKEEIKIVSPFLTPDFVDLLVEKSNIGVGVTLITNDMNGSRSDATGHGKIIPKILQQEKTVDEGAIAHRKKGRMFSTVWLSINILITVGFAWLYWSFVNKTLDSFPIAALLSRWQTIAIFSVSLLVSYIASIAYLNKVNQTVIYQYKYHHMIDFRIFKNKHFGDIHSKIYCIDNKKAYLGSLNYTKNGFDHFFESCVSISNPDAVKKISQSITELFYDQEREQYDDYELAHLYYRWSEQPY